MFCGLFESSAPVVIVREAGTSDGQGAEGGTGRRKAQEIDGTRFGEYAKKNATTQDQRPIRIARKRKANHVIAAAL